MNGTRKVIWGGSRLQGRRSPLSLPSLIILFNGSWEKTKDGQDIQEDVYCEILHGG